MTLIPLTLLVEPKSTSSNVMKLFSSPRRYGSCDGFEEGLSDGNTEGLDEGLFDGPEEGLSDGITEGLDEGLLEPTTKLICFAMALDVSPMTFLLLIVEPSPKVPPLFVPTEYTESSSKTACPVYSPTCIDKRVFPVILSNGVTNVGYNIFAPPFAIPN